MLNPFEDGPGAETPFEGDTDISVIEEDVRRDERDDYDRPPLMGPVDPDRDISVIEEDVRRDERDDYDRPPLKGPVDKDRPKDKDPVDWTKVADGGIRVFGDIAKGIGGVVEKDREAERKAELERERLQQQRERDEDERARRKRIDDRLRDEQDQNRKWADRRPDDAKGDRGDRRGEDRPPASGDKDRDRQALNDKIRDSIGRHKH